LDVVVFLQTDQQNQKKNGRECDGGGAMDGFKHSSSNDDVGGGVSGGRAKASEAHVIRFFWQIESLFTTLSFSCGANSNFLSSSSYTGTEMNPLLLVLEIYGSVRGEIVSASPRSVHRNVAITSEAEGDRKHSPAVVAILGDHFFFLGN